VRHTLLLCSVIIFMLAGTLLGPASADELTTPPTLMDIPLLDRQDIGARWAGMGGACIAIVDDGAAAYWNPAGLARIRRIEMLGTFTNTSNNIETTWLGGSDDASITTTRLEDVAISYPFPTYRGSLVATASAFRKTSYDQFLSRQTTYESEVYEEVEEQEVVLTAWSGAFAVQLSPNAFFGAEGHFYTGNLDLRNSYSPWPGCDVTGARLDSDSDLSGFGGILGLQYVAHPMVSVGVALRTPERLTIKGTTDAGAGCSGIEVRFEDKMTLPYSVALGLGVMPHNFNIALDVAFTNWHELDYEGRVRDEDGEFLYDPTTDIRVGAEYSMATLPLRFRAGYAYVPLELTVFNVDKEKSRYSLGAGAIVEGALALDVAWQRTSFERESTADSYTEKRTLDKAILSVAYRF
jgi:hypothetical protein